MIIRPADEVRACIAYHVLGSDTPASRLGTIDLHPHQRDGLERVRRLLERHGGALLADEAGLGKTFVALAAARDARCTVVIAPAAIRDAWLKAAARAAMIVQVISVEALSRGAFPDLRPDLVIIDEAHHLRSRATKRFAAASALCRRATVLLLSATPVQNSLRDLRTVLSIFLGARADAMPAEELASFVVRRAASGVDVSGVAPLPRLEPPRWLGPIDDVDCLDRILALPRAVPPADGDDGGVLLTYTLVRQWSSSRAALRGALHRRLARGRALDDALAAGRLPSKAELSAWSSADGAQQLAFPELAATLEVPGSASMREHVQRHCDAVREMLAWLAHSPDPDAARVAALRDVLERHRGERVVAFSEYSDTVTAFYRAMLSSARVAMLHHGGGRVAGGALNRSELVARFAPGASFRTPASERIDLLLTTDVLSEGVDLHDASVLVHLDLAWNPARLEQRVGRLRRLGSPNDVVRVYVMGPPAPAERLLRLDQRLRLKLGTAARTVGVAGTILPGLAVDATEGLAPREERIGCALRSWRRESAPAGQLAATVRSRLNGALAAIRCGGQVSLVAVVDGRVTAAKSAVENLVTAAEGDGLDTEPLELERIRESIEGWLRRRFVSDVVDLPALRVAHSRRALLHRVDVISRRAPRHLQPRLAPLVKAARAAATAVLSAGAERVLDEITCSRMSDAAWLQAIGEFAVLHARAVTDEAPRVVALLVLRRT
ncbi:MAG: helicase-related protein [Gemmatimonadaceae bacterium]